MTCDVNKIDSNVTGLRYAEEECPKQLPASPIWYGQEPNTYSDFGATITTVARNPINQTRQQKKGSVTDLAAAAGYNQDLTQTNMERLMQGFVFADARQRASTTPINGTAVTITGVTAADGYAAASGLDAFPVGSIVLAKNFTNASNNGLHQVTTSAAGALAVTPALVDEPAPPADSSLSLVGHAFAAGALSIVFNGELCTLHGVGFSAFNFLPGEWIYLGGDAAASRFTDAYGFARIATITDTDLFLDKVSFKSIASDAGAGKSIQIYFGTIVRNEFDPTLIKTRTYDLERTLGNDANGIQSEHVNGAVPDQFTLTLKDADKVTVDLTYVGQDYYVRTGTEGLVAGARPDLPVEDMFNSTSDVVRTNLAVIDPTNSFPTPLFAFATDATITIKNNVSTDKAIGTLGAIGTTAGMFEVGGAITAYFADVTSAQAVRNNADVTFDLALVKKNAGIIFDVPLLTLGNGRLTVTANQAIMIPLDSTAAQSDFGYTLLTEFFDYLPTIAAAD